MDNFFGDVISSYSRADMLSNGDLIDASEIAAEAGFKLPLAITRAAWEDCVAWTDEDSERTQCYQDQEGRLWDVVFMSFYAATRARNTDRIEVVLARIDRFAKPNPEGVEPKEVKLILVIGPGDTPEPVLTILTPQDL